MFNFLPPIRLDVSAYTFHMQLYDGLASFSAQQILHIVQVVLEQVFRQNCRAYRVAADGKVLLQIRLVC